jgi:hypothetical protein
VKDMRLKNQGSKRDPCAAAENNINGPANVREKLLQRTIECWRCKQDNCEHLSILDSFKKGSCRYFQSAITMTPFLFLWILPQIQHPAYGQSPIGWFNPLNTSCSRGDYPTSGMLCYDFITHYDLIIFG